VPVLSVACMPRGRGVPNDVDGHGRLAPMRMQGDGIIPDDDECPQRTKRVERVDGAEARVLPGLAGLEP